jgi:hypothetical protein
VLIFGADAAIVLWRSEVSPFICFDYEENQPKMQKNLIVISISSLSSTYTSFLCSLWVESPSLQFPMSSYLPLWKDSLGLLAKSLSIHIFFVISVCIYLYAELRQMRPIFQRMFDMNGLYLTVTIIMIICTGLRLPTAWVLTVKHYPGVSVWANSEWMLNWSIFN